jgi:hypothetical protein
MNASGEPYCSNCNYSLVGLTESPRCPECGKPIVEVLQRRGTLDLRGKRFKSRITIFGLPLWCIAIGPHEGQTRGIAKGIIAIGDIAVGVFALGGTAIGVCAIGGMAVGGLAFGGAALGVAALGGGAIGILALGGGAAGVIAAGGGAIGYIACGGSAWGAHTISAMTRDPVALSFFRDWTWLFGSGPGGMPFSLLRVSVWMIVAYFAVAALSVPVLLVGYLRSRNSSAGTPESS